jgi:hypothetical protein
MCSTVAERLALIGAAIDDVADGLGAGEFAGAGMDDLASRLARIWSMLADLDPALAGRLPGYRSGAGDLDLDGRGDLGVEADRDLV